MRRRLLFVATPLVLGTIAYAIASSTSLRLAPRAPAPSIQVPNQVDLGTRSLGPAEATITVRNAGSQPLELTDIRTGCGCMSVHLVGAETGASVKQATVPPGGALDLALKFSVRATDEAEFRATVYLATNDPDRPEVAIPCIAVVNGLLVAAPSHWLVGDVLPGEKKAQRIEFRDTGRPTAQPIIRATSSHPDVVGVRLLAQPSHPGSSPGGTTAARLIAVAELELTAPPSPCGIEAAVSFFEAGSDVPVATIPVTGRVPERVRALPATIVLPRQTGSGPSDVTNLVLQSPRGEPFSLAVVDAGGLEVTPPATAVPKSHSVVAVRWPAGNPPMPGQTERRTLRLAAQFTDGTVELVVPVTYRTPDRAESTRP